MNDEVTIINPIKITDKEENKIYVLEFDRASVKFAESQGFVFNTALKGTAPLTATTDLFYYSFRKNHKDVTREKAEEILFKKLKGLSGEMLTRLYELYAYTLSTLVCDINAEENPTIAVEL